MNQDFIEIKEEIQNNNLFGTYMYEGLEVLISSGIKMMLEKDEKFKKDVEKALEEFENNNFGNMYEYGEKIIHGNEYGEYKSCINENIYIHRENNIITIYFLFER